MTRELIASTSLSKQIFKQKYRFSSAGDVAAGGEGGGKSGKKSRSQALESTLFKGTGELCLFAGRAHSCGSGHILAGADTGRLITLFNCFVMNGVEDDISAIFENLRESALTMQRGCHTCRHCGFSICS